MNTNSNTYTVIYATVLVVVVAAVLAFVSTSLKDRQQRNVNLETEKSILLSVNLAQKADEAENYAAYIENEYKKYITDSYVLNSKGEKISGDAFSITLKSQYDIMKQPNPDLSKLTLPVFVCTLDNGKKIEIFATYGPGLWGPIWGYISVENDYDTVYGATFGHKSETPGLGAEIASNWFSAQFRGKKLYDGNTFTSIQIMKGGAQPGNVHQVDAISGGTITSRSLQKNILGWFDYYLPYIEKQKAALAAAQSSAEEAQSEENKEDK